MALLLQNPGDYLVHDHAVDDAGVAGVASAGLAGREDANPRDLSGGERQRLALEVVLAGEPASVVLLDEPTRGMDRIHKDELAARTGELADGGSSGDGGHARHRVRRLRSPIASCCSARAW